MCDKNTETTSGNRDSILTVAQNVFDETVVRKCKLSLSVDEATSFFHNFRVNRSAKTLRDYCIMTTHLEPGTP